MVHQYQKKDKRRQAMYADNNNQYTEFQVGDPPYSSTKVSYKVGGVPYYRIIEKITPVTFHLKNQLDGTITKFHAEHLQLATVDDCEIPRIKKVGLHVRSDIQHQ